MNNFIIIFRLLLIEMFNQNKYKQKLISYILFNQIIYQISIYFTHNSFDDLY